MQVLAYELRLSLIEGQSVAVMQAVEGDSSAQRFAKSDPPATAEQLEHFFNHLSQMLNDIDFHKGRSPVTIERRLRRLFGHANLDQREVRILRGIFDDAQRMAKMAKEPEE